MKTVLQAILDEIYYPINVGLVENKLIRRELDGTTEFSKEVSESAAYKGALADSLYSLIQQVSISESDKSVGALTKDQRDALLIFVNNLYSSIGEDEVEIESKPMVYIGRAAWQP